MKVTFDIKSIERQVEDVKKRIYRGIVENGYKSAAPEMENIMTDYMWNNVYEKYTPTTYQRTYKLYNSIRSRIDKNSLKVYSDGSDLTRTKEGKPYSFRVKYGHKVYPYDSPYPGAFKEPRDWVEDTIKEVVEHFNQDGNVKQEIVKGIKSNLKSGGR